ncbi:MAG: hypothetical protein GF347_00490 [Candidatus Moranbacteria bacterium]|nr:hypothetical protein [Candidatus Moranbacteria bacterium]
MASREQTATEKTTRSDVESLERKAWETLRKFGITNKDQKYLTLWIDGKKVHFKIKKIKFKKGKPPVLIVHELEQKNGDFKKVDASSESHIGLGESTNEKHNPLNIFTIRDKGDIIKIANHPPY